MWKKGATAWGARVRPSTGVVDKKGGVSTASDREKSYPHSLFHISRLQGGNVERGLETEYPVIFMKLVLYSYRALMLALMSLMTSAISGDCLVSFSMRSMECDRLVMRRIWYMAICRARAVSLVRP